LRKNWVPACAGMTETNHSSFKSGSYFGTDPKVDSGCTASFSGTTVVVR
jgi:hypothetical protein